MTLDLVITIALCALSGYGGYYLRAHMHDVADKAAQAAKDVIAKVK